MIDLSAALLTAGLSLATRLIASWIEKGKPRVRISEVEASIARESEQEAGRLRLRVDDLERATREMMREVVARTPQISYSKQPLTAPALDIDFDPRNPASSKDMLEQLRRRVAEISDEFGRGPEAIPMPRVTLDEPGAPESGAGPRDRNAQLSRAMLEELKDRVRRAEDPR